MIRSRSTTHPFPRLPAALGLLALAMAAPASRAACALPLGLGDGWWLNRNYAEHGRSMDQIFYFIFWLTTFVLVAVQAVLVYFMVKYRRRPDRAKGVYSHGNTRLEMAWTIIPAIILIVVALWTKRVWDDYRYNPAGNDPNTLKVLVVGEQFKWNVLYGGPRNTIGRYLVYPKTTDLKWPPLPEGQTFDFPNVPGPAYLPEEDARKVLNNYIDQVNALGRDYSDPNTNPDPEGKDPELAKLNDRNNALGRILVLPRGRAVEVQISSRDVIHDFFLPNFRTKLDAVPGTRGKLYITAGADSPTPRQYALAELQRMVVADRQDVVAIVNRNTPGAEFYRPARRRPGRWRIAADGQTLLGNGDFITADTLAAAEKAGIPSIFAVPTMDLVCEELCGQGHATMQGKVIVLDEATLREPPYNTYFPPPPPASNLAGAGKALAAAAGGQP